MKKIILLILIPACFVLCGCPDMGESRYYDYSIINKSGTEITFIPYADGNILLDKKVILQNNKTLNETYVDHPLYTGFSLAGVIFVNGILGLSHVEIVFDNKKKIIYQTCVGYNCNKNPRNIFNYENNNELQETYVISREDYENAIDCNGNCY